MIKICGKNYSVTIVGENPLLGDVIGTFVGEKTEIMIREGLDVQVAAETILHESIHAIDYNIGLGLNEHQVTALSAMLYDYLKSNGAEVDFTRFIDGSTTDPERSSV